MTALSIDIGARHVDLCLRHGDGFSVSKLPWEEAPLHALRSGLSKLPVPAGALDEVRLATTLPLNHLLARERAPVALICSRGFADILALGRQDRVDLYDPVARSAAPTYLVDREAVFETAGRIDPGGAETEPPDPSDPERIAAALAAAGCRAVAISLLFAHANPLHELALAKALRAALPGLHISLSHRVDPAPREYERTVATLLDAWLRMIGLEGIDEVERALRDAGFAGRFLVCDGRGVLKPWSELRTDPLPLILGGPAVTGRAGAALAKRRDAVVLDIGSRSSDLTLVRDHTPVLSDPGAVCGLPVRRALVDSESLPIGGATHAGIVEGRLALGDADLPTLDTALQALGRFTGDPRPDPDCEAVVAAVADHLAEAMTRFATRHNVDPVRADLVVSGGGGGLLAADLAKAMRLSRVCLPLHPGAAGAIGLAAAPVRADASAQVNKALDVLPDETLQAFGGQLREALGGRPADGFRLMLAPRPGMHPRALLLDCLPKTAADMRAAYRDAYAAWYLVPPPGPGFLESISAHTDNVPTGLNIAVPATGAQRGPRSLATGAGNIWIPPAWRISTTPAGYVLEREP